MSATNLFMNWSSVSITYGTGTPTVVAVAEVLDVEPDAQTKHEMFYGDALKFPRAIVPTERARTIKITSGNAAALLGIPEDKACTVVATLNDAVNGTAAGGGGITITLVNAMRKSVDVKAPNNKFGAGTITFEAYGATSDTDPLTITAL